MLPSGLNTSGFRICSRVNPVVYGNDDRRVVIARSLWVLSSDVVESKTSFTVVKVEFKVEFKVEEGIGG